MLTPERWQVVERLFHEALAYPPPERQAFVDSSCDDDPEIKSELQSLLAAEGGRPSRVTLAAEVAADRAQGESSSPIGRTFDSYRVVSLLGKGGMGEVYLADDLSLGRRVALKVLPAPFTADALRLRRFMEEARAASALNHPNILTVYQVGALEGRRYIATEFIDGETLRERIARGPLSAREAVDIAAQVAGALRAAHEAGIIHRDIKPENVMVRRDGYVKVLDFGLAKLTEGETIGARETEHGAPRSMTRAGAIVGTFDYMAPEQAAGAAVDARADLYSLTLVLYEMLASRLPPEGSRAKDGALKELPAVPASIATLMRRHVFKRGLATDLALRYSSAAELKSDLEAARETLAAAPFQTRRRVLSVLGLAAAIVAGFFVVTRITPATAAVRSMAVLPLTAIQSDDTDQSHITMGLADAVTARLGELSDFSVTPTSAVRHFAGATQAPADIGRELGVDAVLSGTVLREGEDLRVSLQLTRVRDGFQLWSGHFNERFTSIFEVQDAITTQVMSSLLINTGQLPVHPHRQTANIAAYELYLRGREQWFRRTPQSIRSAIDLFGRSNADDAEFAPAFAGLAGAYALTASGLMPADRFPKAKAAAERALALDAGLADAHNALAFISYKWDWAWEVADREFKRAIELEPNHALAYQWYSEFLSVIGRHEAALAGFAKARALDPYSTPVLIDQAAALVRASHAGESVTLLQQRIQQEPTSAALYNGLYGALWSLHRDDEAFEALVRNRQSSGASEAALGAMRQAFRRGGFAELARADVAALLQADKTSQAPPAYFSRLSLAGTIARQYAVIGDRENALSWLEEAARRRDDGPLAIRTSWYWVKYRDEPRFKAVEALVGMPR